MARLRISHGLRPAAVVIAGLFVASGAAAGQSPPPVQGTVALEGTMNKFYRAVNVVVVTTMDGVAHVYHFAKDLVVHGGKGTGVDALEGLQEGTTVVVHYTVERSEQDASEIDVVGGAGLEVTEGIVTRIDRGAHTITVRYDNGTSEGFRLTERAVAEASGAAEQTASTGTKVVIYYSDERGQKVAHFFKRVSK